MQKGSLFCSLKNQKIQRWKKYKQLKVKTHSRAVYFLCEIWVLEILVFAFLFVQIFLEKEW